LGATVTSKDNDAEAQYQKPIFERWKGTSDKKTVDINKSIIERIRKGMAVKRTEKSTAPARKPKHGFIYIYTSSYAEDHIKIGKTHLSTEERLKVWGKCKMPLTELETGYEDAFDYYDIVEALVALQLHNFRKKYSCRPCGEAKSKENTTTRAKAKPKSRATKAAREIAPAEQQNPATVVEVDEELEGKETYDDESIAEAARRHHHQEWYEIKHEKGKDVVSQWRSWLIDYKPFDDQGELTPYWEWRVKKYEKSLSTVEWDKWTRPEKNDFDEFYWEDKYKKLMDHWRRHDRQFWHVNLTAALISAILFSRYYLILLICNCLIS
jgi:hypothetical protein